MYKGKPVIIAHRPWWRSTIFPWRWYSLTQDNLAFEKTIMADGYYANGDNGGGEFYWAKKTKGEDNG